MTYNYNVEAAAAATQFLMTLIKSKVVGKSRVTTTTTNNGKILTTDQIV